MDAENCLLKPSHDGNVQGLDKSSFLQQRLEQIPKQTFIYF